MTEYLPPDTETRTSGSEHAEQNSQVQYACATCADKGKVSVRLETWTGPRLREIVCPDCAGGSIKLEDYRDSRTRKLAEQTLQNQEEIRKVYRIVLILIAVGVLIYMMSREESPRQVFAKTVPEPEGVTP